MNLKKIFIIWAVLFFPVPLLAQITLPAIFTDNMVLQQREEVKIWGTAKPSKTVKVTTSWDGRTYETPAGADGTWATVVSTPAAGGPYSITISDGRKTELKNILIGEVWIGSGQSNMEMRVADSRGSGEEIAEAARYPEIRLLHIDNKTSSVPMDEAVVRNGGWMVCSPETVADFSAAAYFFGKELHKNLNVPIGIIESCWGGTLAEAWTSAESLMEIPYFRAGVEKVKTLPAPAEEREKIFHEDIEEWKRLIDKIDRGLDNGHAVWADADFDDSSWGDITVPGFIQDQDLGLDHFNGFMWVRKDLEIPASWAGKELTVDLSAVDDNDFTYFNGVEIGHTEGWMAPRRYTIPAPLVRSGKATIAVRIMDTGGKGGIHGDPGSIRLIRSDGETLPLAGKWKYKVSMTLAEAPPMPVNTSTEPNFPTFLYNAMINPLIGFKIKGAVWYQGESNVSRAAQYKDLMPLLIHDWRGKWGYEFPFYMVQLANYMSVQEGAEESEWAELREAQRHTALHLADTGMAVAIDIGEAHDIHPGNKYEVGRRLSLAALARTYGKDIAYSGPVYHNYTIEGDKIRVSFTHTDNGLSTSGGALTGFYIAGADHVFHKAEAVIDGNSVVVSSSQVTFPVAVRYGWANNPVCNLVNGAGLPAGPFRTDDWPSGIKRF